MQNNLKRFFNEVQEGQDLGHHKTQWYMLGSHIIAFFGKIGNPRTAKKSHTSIIIDIERKRNIIYFHLLESTVKYGVHKSIRKGIVRDTDGLYKFIGFDKKERLYWSPDVKLTTRQISAFNDFKSMVYGKRYSKIIDLRTTYAKRFVKKFVKFMSWFFKIKIDDVDFEIPSLQEIQSFYCSGLSARKNYELGVITKEEYANNPYPDPMEFFRGKKEILRIK